MKIGFPLGINVLLWSIVSFIRAIYERIIKVDLNLKPAVLKRKISQVAVCLPAHNEEEVIAESLNSIIKLLPADQVFVASDGSTDNTAQIARSLGCHVLEINPGLGKANALNTIIAKFNLLENYKYILFVDADTQLDELFLNRSLALFDKQPKTAAISAYAVPIWESKFKIDLADFISAYRTKLYQVLQMFLMYGQTWKYTNVNYVVPGFAAMYPVRVLKKLDLATPGIWIEDFNLAFQIHRQRLGLIAHYPGIKAYYHDPLNLKDYWSQVSRWNVGFYQTVRLQGIWPSVFWFATGLFSLEMFLNALITIILPLITFYYGLTLFLPDYFSVNSNLWLGIFQNLLTFWQIIFGIVLMDYALTIVIALKSRRPMLVIYGIGFLMFHYINALILLTSIPKGLLTNSEGKWTHAER